MTAAKLTDSDGDGLADDYGACDQPDLGLPEASIPSSPSSGLTDYFLVTAENFAGESTMGYNSATPARERPNLTPCP